MADAADDVRQVGDPLPLVEGKLASARLAAAGFPVYGHAHLSAVQSIEDDREGLAFHALHAHLGVVGRMGVGIVGVGAGGKFLVVGEAVPVVVLPRVLFEQVGRLDAVLLEPGALHLHAGRGRFARSLRRGGGCGSGRRGRGHGGGCGTPGGAAVDEFSQIGVPALDGEYRGVRAVGVDQPWVGPTGEQEGGGVRVAGGRGVHQRGLAFFDGRVDVRAVVEQRFHGVQLAQEGGHGQGAVELPVAFELVRAGLQEDIGHVLIAGVDRFHQRGPVVVVFDAGVRVGFHQGADGVRMILGGGEEQGGGPFLVLEVGLGVLVEQGLDQGRVSALGGGHQGGVAARVLSVVVDAGL